MEGVGDLLCYSSTFLFVRTSHGHALKPCAYLANSKLGENYYTKRKKIHDRGELNPRSWLWYHARHPRDQSNHKTQVIWKGWRSLIL
jgi:hypothetical protein